jgi:hypothetical protein
MILVENSILAARMGSARGIGVDYSTKKNWNQDLSSLLVSLPFSLQSLDSNYQNGKQGPAREREASQAILSPHGLQSQMCLKPKGFAFVISLLV